jgi:hypothetical protein
MDQRTYRAALVGCSRMGAFIDNEVVGSPSAQLPYSHAAGYEACARTDLVAGSDLRPDVLEQFGRRYRVPPERCYVDYREMIRREQPDILSVATQPEQRAEVMLFAIENGVHALDTGEPTRGGATVAYRGTEVIVGFVESHRRGGARVPFPLVGNRLRFNRHGLEPKQPRFHA